MRKPLSFSLSLSAAKPAAKPLDAKTLTPDAAANFASEPYFSEAPRRSAPLREISPLEAMYAYFDAA